MMMVNLTLFKEKMIQTNEELDSLPSWEDEELGFALQNSQLFQYPLQFGEGASKNFQREPIQGLN